jgi:hypothetical protein
MASAGAAPRFIEFANAGACFFANVFDRRTQHAICPSICTGFASTEGMALRKALSEYIERRAYAHAAAKSLEWASVAGTDGLAAYPTDVGVGVAVEAARENAICEAVERFAWASWWDNDAIKFDLEEDYRPSRDEKGSQFLLSALNDRVPFRRILAVKPRIRDASFQLIILFAELRAGGYLSGGACDRAKSQNARSERAAAEIFRHGLAFRRMEQGLTCEMSFYERRLWYFATGQGDALVARRLRANGRQEVSLPPLRLDLPVQHDLASLAAVHRCVFDGQPPFVAGALERLCL